MTRQQAISRQCAMGIPISEIAAEFGISVAQALHIDAVEQSRKANRPRVQYQAPKPRDWRTARPAVDRVRRGEPCRTPECSETVERGSYCAHCRLIVYARVA